MSDATLRLAAAIARMEGAVAYALMKVEERTGGERIVNVNDMLGEEEES